MKNLQIIASSYIPHSRSKFQLEKFVIGQHDTPEMQYHQILVEAKNLILEIETIKIRLQKDQLQLSILESSSDQFDLLTAKEIRLGMGMSHLTLVALDNELKNLEELFEKYPSYTSEQIENNQPEYWEKRLTRQVEQDVLAIKNGITVGNLQSITQASFHKKLELE